MLSKEEVFLANLGLEDSKHIDSHLMQMDILQSLSMDKEGLLMMLHPLAFAAKVNNKDTPMYSQAMNGPNALGYMEAMKTEIKQLEEKEPWDLISLSQVPEGVNILDLTWAFKWKRYPDGSIHKLKARFCVHRDQQIEGVDFFNTYAPVEAWSTVQLLLILSVIMGLAMKQVNYKLAFIQADIKDDIYVQMAKGFEQPGHVYKLKKSVYGLRQSPLNFFEHLKNGLES